VVLPPNKLLIADICLSLGRSFEVPILSVVERPIGLGCEPPLSVLRPIVTSDRATVSC
jgi:hypothetical protein